MVAKPLSKMLYQDKHPSSSGQIAMSAKHGYAFRRHDTTQIESSFVAC
jgi:hypothetical protein